MFVSLKNIDFSVEWGAENFLSEKGKVGQIKKVKVFRGYDRTHGGESNSTVCRVNNINYFNMLL